MRGAPMFERADGADGGRGPDVAAGLHRWLAGSLADRLSDTTRAIDALMD